VSVRQKGHAQLLRLRAFLEGLRDDSHRGGWLDRRVGALELPLDIRQKHRAGLSLSSLRQCRRQPDGGHASNLSVMTTSGVFVLGVLLAELRPEISPPFRVLHARISQGLRPCQAGLETEPQQFPSPALDPISSSATRHLQQLRVGKDRRIRQQSLPRSRASRRRMALRLTVLGLRASRRRGHCRARRHNVGVRLLRVQALTLYRTAWQHRLCLR
jgi:hypothetical protein